MSNYYKDGSHNVICDSCGKKYKREQVRMTWDGYMMCTVKGCWYPKHPNETPRKIRPDGLPVPNARDRNVSYITFPPLHRVSDMISIIDPDMRVDDDPSKGGVLIEGTRYDF